MMSKDQTNPRDRRRLRTEQAILDAALALIREHGVDGLSIRAIAERIDYSPAGLYEYYASKEEIIGALCLQGFQRFAQALGSVDKGLPAEEYMVEMGLAYVDFALQNTDFFLLMFTTAPLLFPEFTNDPSVDIDQHLTEQHLTDDDAFTILLRGVERCAAEGIFQPQPGFGVLEMARAAWSMTHGIAMLQLSLMRRIPFEKPAMRTALSLLFRGMKTLNN